MGAPPLAQLPRGDQAVAAACGRRRNAAEPPVPKYDRHLLDQYHDHAYKGGYPYGAHTQAPDMWTKFSGHRGPGCLDCRGKRSAPARSCPSFSNRRPPARRLPVTIPPSKRRATPLPLVASSAPCMIPCVRLSPRLEGGRKPPGFFPTSRERCRAPYSSLRPKARRAPPRGCGCPTLTYTSCRERRKAIEEDAVPGGFEAANDQETERAGRDQRLV